MPMTMRAQIFPLSYAFAPQKRSGTYRFLFAVAPKILVPTFFKELRWKYLLRIGKRGRCNRESSSRVEQYSLSGAEQYSNNIIPCGNRGL